MVAWTAADEAELILLGDELCRRSLVDYVRACYPTLTLDPWQVELCQRLQEFVEAIERGEGPRMMVHVPPQCGKSTIVARAFPAWLAGRHPEWPGIIASYAANLATKHGRWIRNHLRSAMHRRVFPASELATDSQAVDDMALTAGGQIISRGVGGGTTGNPVMWCIVDDPFADRAAADSKTIRDAVDDWYTSVATTRLGPGAGVLIMHTRWHLDDLAGRLIEKSKDGGDEWKVFSYPAINPDGTALRCRFSLAEFKRKQRNMPKRDWLSLYQQTPVSEGGLIFQLSWIREEEPPQTWRAILSGDHKSVARGAWPTVYQSWDLAGTKQDLEDGGCFSVGGSFIKDWMQRWWLIDLVRGKWDSGQLVEQMLSFAWKWRANMVWGEDPVALYLEPFLTQRMQQSGKHFRLARVSVCGRGDKVARAQASAVPVMSNGSFYVPAKAPWLPAFKEELGNFPAGSMKDQVDMLSLGLAEAMIVAVETPQPAPTDASATKDPRLITWNDLTETQRQPRRSPWSR